MEWHRGIRRTRIDFNEPTIIGSTNGIGNSKANNNGSVAITNKKVNTESFSNFAQLAAWGLPAVQTVAVLVARVVDADELLGKFKCHQSLDFMFSFRVVCVSLERVADW